MLKFYQGRQQKQACFTRSLGVYKYLCSPIDWWSEDCSVIYFPTRIFFAGRIEFFRGPDSARGPPIENEGSRATRGAISGHQHRVCNPSHPVFGISFFLLVFHKHWYLIVISDWYIYFLIYLFYSILVFFIAVTTYCCFLSMMLTSGLPTDTNKKQMLDYRLHTWSKSKSK